MLTGDENIIDVNFTVFWVVKDAGAYLFDVEDPDATIKAVAESAMREVVGRSQFESILTQDREEIQIEVKDLMQKTLDEYGAGVTVTNVNMQKADPPGDVIDAYRDVQAARADQEKMRNVAEGYANKVIPEARGRAARIVQDAEAYRQQVIAEASGQAKRFLSVLAQYRSAPDVTRRRMYLETMSSILATMNKVIVDDSAKGVVPYFQLPNMLGRRRGAQAGAGCDASAGRRLAMSRAIAIVAGLIGIVVLIALFSSFYFVNQTEEALVLQFGAPQRVITDPGLHFKTPLTQNVVFFDKRVLLLDAPTEEIIASDKKRMMVDAFARWRITDPLRFYQSLIDHDTALMRLTPILSSSVRRVLGSQTFAAMLSGKRAQLMIDIKNAMNQDTAGFGIAIVDVRIRHADLPQANSLAIYQRMQKEREREAAEYRAEGDETAQRIRARARARGDGADRRSHPRIGNPARRGRRREDPHPGRRVQPGPGLLRLLPLDAGLPGLAGPGRHHGGPVARQRLPQIFRQGAGRGQIGARRNLSARLRVHPAAMAHRRYGTLDGLRGVAALAVVFGHLFWPFNLFLAHTYLAVDLFFLMSGFVLAATYERRLAAGWGAGKFAVVRLRRLWPLYALGLVVGLGFYAAVRLIKPSENFLFPGDAGGRASRRWACCSCRNGRAMAAARPSRSIRPAGRCRWNSSATSLTPPQPARCLPAP